MDDANDLYRQYLLDVYKHLSHKHAIIEDEHTFSFETYNASCGDRIQMHMHLDPLHEKIIDMSFTGEGCLLSTVSTELLADAMIGKTLKDFIPITLVMQLDTMQIHPTPTRMKCIELPILSANHLLQLSQNNMK